MLQYALSVKAGEDQILQNQIGPCLLQQLQRLRTGLGPENMKTLPHQNIGYHVAGQDIIFNHCYRYHNSPQKASGVDWGKGTLFCRRRETSLSSFPVVTGRNRNPFRGFLW